MERVGLVMVHAFFFHTRRWALGALGLLGAGAACNRPICLGMHPATEDRNAPVLHRVALEDASVQGPWTLVMGVDFSDRDGDLGDGNLLLYLGASAPVVLPLASYFQTSELPLGATSGRVGVPLFMSQGAVPDDTTVRVGFQLQDARDHYSNCYALDLHFDVTLPESYNAPNTQQALTPAPASVLCGQAP